MSTASTNHNSNDHRAEFMDDAGAAAVLFEVERTNKAPGKPTRSRLDPEWAEGVIQAQQDGRDGTDRWLKAVRARTPRRHEAIASAITTARETAQVESPHTEPIAGQIGGEPWEEPTLGSRPPAVPFPVEVFPPPLADLVVAQAAALNTPVDFVAVSALFTGSTAMGRSVVLRIRKTWEERPALYLALVAMSGEGKSTPIMEMTRPLWDIAREAMEEWKTLKEREARKKDEDRQGVPPLKRTVIDQSTVEAIGQILRDNPRGIGQIRDELTALVSGMDQYKSGGKGSDRQFYLSAESGSPWSIDLKKNQDGVPIIIPHPFLSIIGGLVDSKLATLSEAKDRDDGFIERLSFAVPDPVHVEWRDDEVDDELIEDWKQAVRRLWDTPMTGDPESPRPWFVKFEPAAMTAFKLWFNAHSEETRSLDFPAHLRGSWSKMRGRCGRLALLLDRLAWAYDPTDDDRARDVSLTCLRGAIRLVDYFKAHARRAHALIRGYGGEDNEDGRAILKWAFNTERRTFNERGVKLNFKTRFRDGLSLDLAIAWLIARRCIRRLPTPPIGPKGGQPASRSYEVNPALLNPVLLKPDEADG